MTDTDYTITGMTCNSCAMRIESTIQKIEGVEKVRVNFKTRQMTVSSKKRLSITSIEATLHELGNYRITKPHDEKVTSVKKPSSVWLWGILGSIGIGTIFYLVQVLGMQSWTAPAYFLLDQWYFVLPLVIGFGIQMALFRAIHLAALHKGGVAMATSGTVSTSAMLACCMHNLTLLLPILGASGVAAFFAAYQTEVFLFSILVVVSGIIYMIKKYNEVTKHH